jgi:hypothetical protein
VKVRSGFGGTKAAPAGAAGNLGSGEAIALSDGRTPGLTPPSEEDVPVYPTIVGAIFDKRVGAQASSALFARVTFGIERRRWL